MKKLSFLLVILMVASVSNAAYMNILVNGTPLEGVDVAPSDMITMVFGDDMPGVGGMGAMVVDVSAGDQVGDPVDLYGSWMLIGFSFEVVPDGDGFLTTVSGSNLTMAVPAGDFWEQTFHVPDWMEESDYITITHTAGDWNGNYPEAFEEVVLHIVPEPTTIALLGLGALSLLRRRRKA